MPDIVKRCELMTPGDVQCVKMAGHEPPCLPEGEGWRELDAAVSRKHPALLHSGDLTAKGIYVMPVREAQKMNPIKRALRKVIIGVHDDGGLEVVKGVQEGQTIEAIAASVQAAGGKVEFGVGSITIKV